MDEEKGKKSRHFIKPTYVWMKTTLREFLQTKVNVLYYVCESFEAVS